MSDSIDSKNWDDLLPGTYHVRSHRASTNPTLKRSICVASAVVLTCTGLTAVGAATHNPQAQERYSVTFPVERAATPVPPSGSENNDPRVSREYISRSVQRAHPLSRTELVIKFALAQQGKPYVWGSAGPDAYDCSGLAMRAYEAAGIALPHYTGSMLTRGERIDSIGELHPGDLIFPNHGHVAVYLGNGMQVAAANPRKGVVVQPVYAFYTGRRYL